MSRFWVLATVAVALGPSPAGACLWDYDTLAEERRRFPGALELITGKFRRHSPAFYKWRVANRLERLEKNPADLAALDDLAVAYDKLGDPAKALETINKKDAIKPGLYETEANRGTFLFHAGRLEEGLPHIRKAIAINPDAHFGREKYQLLLVEYLLERRKERVGKDELPLMDVGKEEVASVPAAPKSGTDFATWLFHRPPPDGPRPGADPERERQAAIKGVLGMMRFGKHDSPVLLEALAALLMPFPGLVEFRDVDGYTAARAYLAAARSAPTPQAKAAYRALVPYALHGQRVRGRMDFSARAAPLEEAFATEQAEADAWWADHRRQEEGWIAAGRNPETEAARLTDEPAIQTPDLSAPTAWDRWWTWPRQAAAKVIGIAAVVVGLVSVVYLALRLRRRAAGPAAAGVRAGGPPRVPAAGDPGLG